MDLLKWKNKRISSLNAKLQEKMLPKPLTERFGGLATVRGFVTALTRCQRAPSWKLITLPKMTAVSTFAPPLPPKVTLYSSLWISDFIYLSYYPTGETKSAQIEVRVLFSPKVVALNKVTIQTGSGLAAEFTCVVTGQPEPKVSWYKGTEVLRLNDRIITANAGSKHILTINRYANSIKYQGPRPKTMFTMTFPGWDLMT